MEHRFQPVGPPDLSGGKGWRVFLFVPNEFGTNDRMNPVLHPRYRRYLRFFLRPSAGTLKR
ncbi:MAG: hypothetical protein RBT36_05235 [Desulfobulbus sp.]|nr:hypothetical protein [Desulfobulbus sp.]